jgi:hypothetical protein
LVFESFPIQIQFQSNSFSKTTIPIPFPIRISNSKFEWDLEKNEFDLINKIIKKEIRDRKYSATNYINSKNLEV